MKIQLLVKSKKLLEEMSDASSFRCLNSCGVHSDDWGVQIVPFSKTTGDEDEGRKAPLLLHIWTVTHLRPSHFVGKPASAGQHARPPFYRRETMAWAWRPHLFEVASSYL